VHVQVGQAPGLQEALAVLLLAAAEGLHRLLARAVRLPQEAFLLLRRLLGVGVDLGHDGGLGGLVLRLDCGRDTVGHAAHSM